MEAPPPAGGGGEPKLRAVDGASWQRPRMPAGRSVAVDMPDAARGPPADDLSRRWPSTGLVARYVKSNAIVIAESRQTVGIGAGQMRPGGHAGWR